MATGGGYRSRRAITTGCINVPSRRCKIRFHGADNLQVPIQLFDSERNANVVNANGDVKEFGQAINFRPGDPFTKFLEEQWVSFDQPWLVRLKTTTDNTDVSAAEAAPTGSERIDVSGLDVVTIATGAHTLTNVSNYTVEIHGQATNGWAKIFETTLSTAWTQAINLNRKYTRLYVRISDLSAAAAGAVTVSKAYSTDGMASPPTATLYLSAWYEMPNTGE